MSDKLLLDLENLLNEEKWTRATINNYTIKNFDDLNLLIEKIKDNKLIQEAKTLTDEYLKHNKNSIISLYINSILSLEDSAPDEINMLNLTKIFSDNFKWNIVEYLCKKFLEYGDNKYILRILIETYNNLNKKDELPELWERLLKVDFEEAEIALKLANYKEQKNEIDEAISYYKKAINRFILNKNFTQVEDLWKKLLNFDSISYDYFLNLDKKISKMFNNERSIELLKYLYEIYLTKDEYDICLKILKLILEKNPNDEYSRKEIVSIYRKKYKDHSYLEEYIKISNLEGQWRNINDAILSFERHIVFDKGNFVYHKTWGIGRIKDVSKDIFTIDFQTKKDHKMTLKMALDSLKTLPKNHIWVLKLKNLEKLKEMVKNDIPWALKTLIISNDNQITMKDIKKELVPDILPPSAWNNWWAEAKKVLKTDPKFGTLDDSNEIYELRDKPLSFEEKTYNMFKAAKDFNQRFMLTMDFIKNESDLDSDYIDEMINYFQTYINSLTNVNEQTICSYLLLQDIQKRFPYKKINLPYSFIEYFEKIENPITIYENIFIPEYKKDFLTQIKKYYRKWDEVFIDVFYLYPNKFIFEDIMNKDKNLANKIIKELISAYKEYREAFLWIVTNVLNEELAKKLNIDYDNIIFLLIHLIEIIAKDIENKRDLAKNKKISNQIKDYLFKNNVLVNYISKSNEEFCKRLYDIINELYILEPEYIIMIKNKISEKFPDIDVEDKGLKYDETKAKTSIMDKLLTCAASYNKMQQELIKIKEVDIPENSKEIGWAMEKGDLRENAEFKAAKEKQTFLQNKMKELMNDLARATIVKKEDIKGDFITFGTVVELYDKINKTNVEYTIMGPWESNTEKNIISYQSPFGSKLIDKRVNDEVKFKINKNEHHYIVKKIRVADF